MQPRRRSDRTPGFTLIELLVVVAIIVSLLAILLPSMSRAIEISHRAICASNQRQVTVAMINYAGDRLGLLPAGAQNSLDNHIHPAQMYDGTWRIMRDDYGLTGAVMFCPSAYAIGTGDALMPALDAYPLGGQLDATAPPNEGDLYFGPANHNNAWGDDDRRFYGYAVVSGLEKMGCTAPNGEVPVSAKRMGDGGACHMLADRNSINAAGSVKAYQLNAISHFTVVDDRWFPEGGNRAHLDGAVGWIDTVDMGEDESALTPNPSNPREWDGIPKYNRSSCNHVKERYYW